MIREKRQHYRFSSRIGFVSSDETGLNFSFITDLSRSGAFIETEKIQKIGSPFRFVLSNGLVSSPISAKVTRVRDAFFHGGKSGMGVRFERLDRQSKMLRDDLLLFLMNEKHQTKWANPN